MTFHEALNALNRQPLKEQKIFASKAGIYIDIPDYVQLIPQADVVHAVSELGPEMMFSVGYATPVYFYKKLLNKFTLIKLTEMRGYTGLDYKDTDSSADAEVTAADRYGISAEQSANPTGTYYHAGYDEWGGDNNKVKSRIDGMRKDYLDGNINKVVKRYDRVLYQRDPSTGRKILDANKQPIVSSTVTDLNTILFYPEVGSTPKVTYFFDGHDGNGFVEIQRELLVDYVYKAALDVIRSEHELGEIDKYEDMTDTEIKFLGNVRAKALAVIANDGQTIASTIFGTGHNLDDPDDVKRPNVRSLYTNQIYWIDTPRREIGRPLI